MIKHHKTDSERKAWLAEASEDLQEVGLTDNVNMTRVAWEKLLELNANLLERVRMLEAREGTDRQ